MAKKKIKIELDKTKDDFYAIDGFEEGNYTSYFEVAKEKDFDEAIRTAEILSCLLGKNQFYVISHFKDGEIIERFNSDGSRRITL